VLALLFAAGPWTDAGSRYVRVRNLLATAPNLDRELAWRSCVDDEPEWRTYCRRLRPRRLMDAFEVLQEALEWRPTFASFVRARAPIEPCMLRVGRGIASEFDYPLPLAHARRNLGRSDASDFALYRTRLAVWAALTETLSTAARLRRLDSLSDRYHALGEPAGIESIQLSAAQLELESGNRERFRQRLEAAHTVAGEIGDHYLLCQILGQLGDLHEQAEEEDSMRACFTDGLAFARRHGFTDQAERFLLFEAQHAIRQGRPAFAADRLAQAVEIVEADGDRNDRLRLALRQARFFASLDCWEQVDRTLRRLPVLLRDPQRFVGPEARKLAFEVDVLQARAAFAERRTREAQSLLEPWLTRMPVDFRRVGLAQLDETWSEGLMHGDDWAGVLAVCARGLAHCDRAHVTDLAIPLAFRRARALEALGRLAESRRAADEAVRRLSDAPRVDRESWIPVSQVLRARLRMRAGDVAGGRTLLREVLDGHSSSTSAGPADPGERTGLSARETAHELGHLSPAEGFAFELAWRSRARNGPGGAASDPFAPAPAPISGTHLVYHFFGDRLLRWTATRGSVRLDTLPLPARDCLREVREAVTLLRTEPPPRGRSLGPRAEEALARLGREILPGGLAGRAGIPSVEISPDGPLLSLPFEALPVPDADGTPPLALVADVVYEAGWSARVAQATRPRPNALIVSNPAIPPEIRHRYAWTGPLVGSDAEARCALRRWPAATLLQGADATRARLLRLATNATQVYVAAHHVRDPGAPFLGFLPLAPDSGGEAGESLLESADIRRLDLSSCRLAVLAACASGAPSRVAEEPGPTLGDAFLDAGAHAVVRSFWDVGDEETRVFMQRFLAADSANTGTVRALAAARRAALQDTSATPRVWAAWSVEEVRSPTPSARSRPR